VSKALPWLETYSTAVWIGDGSTNSEVASSESIDTARMDTRAKSGQAGKPAAVNLQSLSTTEAREPGRQSTESDPQRARSVVPFAREEKLQEWEGRVVAVSANRFKAQLIDLTAGNEHETESGDFPIEELSDSDRKLLRENAIFRWLIGYRYIGSTKERFARIVFRRLPAWSAMELRAARKSARKLALGLRWD
jgi:hypothetical protein